MSINEYIGYIVIILGLLFVIIGLIGLFKYKTFYARATMSSLIDTAGFITIVLGVIIYNGFTFFSLKASVIIFLMLLLNPLTNNIIVQGAYKSGHGIKEEVK